MPRHLISDAHEWINEIPTVPIYALANLQQRERALQDWRGKKTLLSLTLVWIEKWFWGRSIGGTLRGPMKYLHLEHYFSHCIAKKWGGAVRLRPLLLALISKNAGRQSARAGPLHLERNRWGGSGWGGACGVKAHALRGLGSTPSQFPFECRGALRRADALPLWW